MASNASASRLPATMRAWHRPSRGPVATHLLLTDEYPMPAMPRPGSSDVLVRVTHVALEYSIRLMLPIMPALPLMPSMIPELELAGIVVAAGSKAPTDVREAGTRVLGWQDLFSVFFQGKGVLAEYVSISGDRLVRVPDAMAGERGMEQAASIVGGGATALQMVRSAEIHAGDRVLVNGASGAVGSMAVQLAKERGAYVVGIASGRNEQLVRGIGADEFIDYTLHPSSSLSSYLASAYTSPQFDHILDCVGSQDLYLGSPAYLKQHGAVINVGAMTGGIPRSLWNWFQNTWRPVWLGGPPRRYLMFSTTVTRDDPMYLLRLAEEGKLEVLTDSVWEMSDALEAYKRLASNRARGKVVIKVAGR